MIKLVFVLFAAVASINVIHAMDIGSACLTREEVKQVIRSLQYEKDEMESKMAQCGCNIPDGRVTNGIDEMETAETVANFNPDSTNSILPASAPVPILPARAPAPAPTPAPEPEQPEGCPVDKPNYIMVNGKCLFYEQKRFDHSAAQENCGGVMPNGKLFEPTDDAENELVYKQLRFMFGASYIRIGINDKSSEGNFTYDSSAESVPMGPWVNGQPDGGLAQNCVVYGNYGDGGWLDYFCTGRLTSICESTHYNL